MVTVNLPRLQSISRLTAVLSTAATELLILHQEGLRNPRGRGMHRILTQDLQSIGLFIQTGFVLKDPSLEVYESKNNGTDCEFSMATNDQTVRKSTGFIKNTQT
jgi:hypothetical protein